jgi:hypothetical protein
MLALLRLLLVVLVVCTIAFFSIHLYARTVARNRLEQDWSPEKGLKDDYIDAGMQEYHQSMRKKLIWAVYIVPVGLILLIFYLTNYA